MSAASAGGEVEIRDPASTNTPTGTQRARAARGSASLQVSNLTVTSGSVALVRDVSFRLAPGKMVALAGESGSGKSVTSLALLGLLPPSLDVEGRIEFGGDDVLTMDEMRLREYRARRARMVFQDPWSALNPMLSIGTQLIESARSARAMSRREARALAVELLEKVGVSDPQRRMAAYPRAMSGGILQRIVIAMALAAEPELILCDEPTTALDATTETQIMDLIRRLCDEFGTAVMLTSHDLALIGQYSDDLLVMYAGRVVDEGPSAAALANPQHPYTRALVESDPSRTHVMPRVALPALEGFPPSPGALPPGCELAPRCPLRQQICVDKAPPLAFNPRSGGRTACWIVNPALAS